MSPQLTFSAPERKSVIRPKEAATLIVIRRDPDGLRVLMGRRSDAHAFMPGAVVFPGGRVDRGDRRAAAADELHPTVLAKLSEGVRRPDPLRARALALAAIRETAEETGILIGTPNPAAGKVDRRAWPLFREAGLLPALGALRLVARAITPPGHVRRFDARFFAVFADAIGAEVEIANDELKCPAWLSFDEARAHALQWITRTVLDGLAARLQREPDLDPDGPVPFYATRRAKRIVEEL